VILNMATEIMIHMQAVQIACQSELLLSGSLAYGAINLLTRPRCPVEVNA